MAPSQVQNKIDDTIKYSEKSWWFQQRFRKKLMVSSYVHNKIDDFIKESEESCWCYQRSRTRLMISSKVQIKGSEQDWWLHQTFRNSWCFIKGSEQILWSEDHSSTIPWTIENKVDDHVTVQVPYPEMFRTSWWSGDLFYCHILKSDQTRISSTIWVFPAWCSPSECCVLSCTIILLPSIFLVYPEIGLACQRSVFSWIICTTERFLCPASSLGVGCCWITLNAVLFHEEALSCCCSSHARGRLTLLAPLQGLNKRNRSF